MLVRDVEELECSHDVSGNIEWYSHFGSCFSHFSKKKLNTCLPDDQFLLLQGLYLQDNMKTQSLKKCCARIPKASLFMMAKTWQYLRLSIHRRMEKQTMTWSSGAAIKKKRVIDTHYSTEKSQKHSAE